MEYKNWWVLGDMTETQWRKHIQDVLFSLERRIINMATNVSDLQAADQALDTSIQNAISEISSLATQLANAANSGNTDSATIAAIAADIRSRTDALNNAVSGAQSPASGSTTPADGSTPTAPADGSTPSDGSAPADVPAES